MRQTLGYASSLYHVSSALRAYADATAAAARESGRGALQAAYRDARAGDASDALSWVERAYEQNAPDLAYIGVRPELEFLQSDPAFLDVLQKMGLPPPEGG